MNKEDVQSRRLDLQRQLSFANSLGVRAEVCGDAEQKTEAARLRAEALAALLEIDTTPPGNLVDPTACPECIGMGCDACNRTGDRHE